MSISDEPGQVPAKPEQFIKPDERIGILLVHGIGEQRQFEHLLEVARNLCQAIKADRSMGTLETEITVQTRPEGAYRATEQTWSAHKAPIILRVRNQLGFTTDFEFHEVWWADLGEPSTLKTIFTFWFWGLSLWISRRYTENLQIDNLKERMYPPHLPGTDQAPVLGVWGRVNLFGVSLVALLIMPVMAGLNRLLGGIFGLQVRLDLISNYLNRTKIFSQQRRNSPGPITDANFPPRIGIRRRMIQAMVKMALEDYDRWYIFAHSQGTVLAFNGLMETEQCLPNYLDPKLWRRVQKSRFSKTATADNDKAYGRMRPQRPTWLRPEDLIDRTQLFQKLRGVITYGSPLSKFAHMWPAIVNLNQQEQVFPNSFEWINVYDPTDPVAGPVDFFHPKTSSNSSHQWIPPYPKDYPYKAKGWHLLSHLNYLTYEAKRTDRLINHIARWLLSEESFENSFVSTHSWKLTKGKVFRLEILRIFTWSIAGVIFLLLLLGIILSLLLLLRIPLTAEVILSCLCGLSSGGLILLTVVSGGRWIMDELSLRIMQHIKQNVLDLFEQNPAQPYTLEDIKKLFSIYQPNLLQQALQALVAAKLLKQVNEQYFFPIVKFKLSVGSQGLTDESLTFLQKYKAAICTTLESELGYDPEQEGENHVAIDNYWLLYVSMAKIYVYHRVESIGLIKYVIITDVQEE